MQFGEQSVVKPGFVVDDHLSSHAIADMIKRVSTGERIALYTDLLAADRVYLLRMSPYDAVGSYPTRFTFASGHDVIDAMSTNEVVSFLWHFP